MLSFGELVFGRAKSSDVVIDWDRSISSKHFKIEKQAEHFVLQDLGSTNGTFVNGKSVTAGQLNHGDKILAGSTIFAVLIAEAVESSESSSSLSSSFNPFALVTAKPKQPKQPKQQSSPSEPIKPTEKLRRTVSPDVFLRQVRLRITSAEEKGTVYWISPGQTLIFGRTDNSDCCLDFDPLLSGRHFSVTCHHDHCEIEDLESRSGTRLNGAAITKTHVFDGDQVLAGSTQFIVEVEGIDGPVFRTGANFVVAPPASSAVAHKFEAIKSKCASGLTRIHGKLPDPDALVSLFEVLQQQPTFYVLIDFSHIGLAVPEGFDVDDCKLFQWLPAVAAMKTPLLLRLDELPDWKAYLDEAWGSDALIGIQSALPKEELLDHLHERLTESSHGPEAARGIVGFCWPSVLESLLANDQQVFIEKFLGGINLIVIEVPGDPESWQCYSREVPEKFLATLQVKVVESPPASKNIQAAAPE